MLEYKIPSIDAYHKRKIFHSNEKHQYETTKEWFDRVFESLNGCAFGEFGDFMFIDKFIAGLDYEAFQKFVISTKITIDEIRSMDFDSDDNSDTFIDIKPDLNNSHDTYDMLAEVDIKIEVSHYHSTILLSNLTQKSRSMYL